MGDKEQLYNLLKDTFFLLDDGDRQLFNRFNLTVPRFYALFHIGEEPGISSSRLSERMLCDKSNVTRIIKALIADGLVMRKPHETDGRSLRLYLTEEGSAVREQVVAEHTAYNETRLDCITELEQRNLVEGLEKLNEKLRLALYPLKTP